MWYLGAYQGAGVDLEKELVLLRVEARGEDRPGRVGLVELQESRVHELEVRVVRAAHQGAVLSLGFRVQGAEMWEKGSYLRLIDLFITQL